MLQRSHINHFAFSKQFPFGENRLAYYDSSTGGTSDSDLESNIFERFGSALDLNTAQGRDAMAALRRKEASARRGNQNKVEDIAGRNRASYLLRAIPVELISRTNGKQAIAAYLREVAGDKRFVKLAKQAGVSIATYEGEQNPIDSLLAQFIAKEGSGNIDALIAEGLTDTRLVAKLRAYIKRDLLSWDQLEKRAKGSSSIETIEPSVIQSISMKKQRLLSNNNTTLLGWLGYPSSDNQKREKLAELGITNQGQVELYISQWEQFREKIEDIDRGMIGQSNWNMAIIDKMIDSGASYDTLQKALREQLEGGVTVLDAILQQRVQEEVQSGYAWLQRQRTWVDEGKKKHGWNKRAQDQGFLSDPDIGVSCSRIEKELESIERSLESAIAISPEHAVDRIEQLRWMRQGHIVQTKEKESVLVGLREEQKEADAWKSMITRDINDIFTQHPTRDDQKKRANSVGQSSDVFTSLDELRIDLQKNDKVNTAVYDYHVRRSFAIVTMVLGNSKITSELEAQKHLKSIGLQREESSTGANNILAGIVDHATKDTPEQSIFAEQQGTEDIEPELMEFDTPDAQQSMQNIVNTVLETRRRINRAVDSILESNFVNEGLCASAGLPRQLCIRRDTLEHYLDSFEHGSTHENRQLLTRVQTEVYKLEYAATLISNIPLLQIDRFEAIGNMQNVNGYYDQSPDRIGIRNDMSPTEYERVLVHERGHAAFHYLTRKAEVFPFFLEAKYQQLHEKNSSIDTLLDSLAEEYGLLDEWDDMLKQAHGDETLARQVLRERILEEAYAQKEEYKNGENDTGPSSQSLELFRALNALEEDDEPEPQSEHLFRVSPDVQIRNNITTKMYNRRTISDEDQQDQGETAEVEGAHPVEKTLKEIQARVEKMRIFAQSNQKHANELAPYIEAFQKNHDDLFGVFSTQMLDGKPYPKPEDRVEFWNAVKSVDENTKNVMDSINKYDADTRDVNRIKPESRNLKDILWKEITWMSPLDIWLMFKDASEDIKRMWERKSALNRSEVGSKLFEIFPNVSHNFLGLGYLGRLSDEFERRQEEKENEEVDVWKKGLDSKDPFVLNEMLTNMTNKDQAKAILSLLAEKGRIEWSNEELWKTLNFLSSYKMPFDECRRDSLLRDNWLRKLISEIWGDKDLYNEWRRTNDDKFQSGKKQYENLTDTLAQHSPAMASELERQLRIFTDSKKNNETPPEDVNPHIYEEILEYAMTKGKMNMEQKFYYLIQGVAVGLLPLERLEIINPIVLQNFPFIDYFSSQNNTIPEVMAIAAKIKEPGSFEPGPRTQLFLQFEMARNESTRQRVLKVIRSGDSIDHEDIPMLMAFLDYGGINEMTTTFSGNRQRMTKEGAKNGYVGFNTVFKSYGMKALLDKNNQGKGIESVRFTKADANVLARSLAAYVQYDNLVTGQTGAVGGARQTLTWEQINQETMPSGGDKNVRDFRNPMNNFVAAAVKKLEINEIETKGGKISVDEYIGGTDDAYRTKIGSNGIARGRGSDRKSKNNDEEIFNATNNFVKQLADKIYENQDEFRNLLAQYASASAEQGGLINEGSKQLSPDIVSSSLQRSSVEKELKEGRISGYQDFAGIMAAQAA